MAIAVQMLALMKLKSLPMPKEHILSHTRQSQQILARRGVGRKTYFSLCHSVWTSFGGPTSQWVPGLLKSWSCWCSLCQHFALSRVEGTNGAISLFPHIDKGWTTEGSRLDFGQW